jgi:hypothetical protein
VTQAATSLALRDEASVQEILGGDHRPRVHAVRCLESVDVLSLTQA